jgi:hypothetical protein
MGVADDAAILQEAARSPDHVGACIAKMTEQAPGTVSKVSGQMHKIR